MGTSSSNKHLSPLAAWAFAFGTAVGWGAFVMPGTLFLPKAGPLGTSIGVFVGAAIMAVIAWNYHYMTRCQPGPGGAFAFASRAFGIDHGFLCAWFLSLTYMAIIWANATALTIVGRGLFGDMFRFGFNYIWFTFSGNWSNNFNIFGFYFIFFVNWSNFFSWSFVRNCFFSVNLINRLTRRSFTTLWNFTRHLR